MSNLIPPLLSSSPPPILGPLDEDDDDEFGDFRAAADSYDCDDFSLPPSPQKSPEKEVKSDLFKVNLDINSNNSQKVTSTIEMPTQNIVCEEIDKDFQDRRKSIEGEQINIKLCEIEVNCSNSQPVAASNIFDTQDNDIVCENEIVASSNKEVDGASNDQISEVKDCSNETEDEFSDLQCGVSSTVTNDCDEIQHDVNNVEIQSVKNVNDNQGQSDLNSFTNEEFSESLNLDKSNSEDLSELNEIKSEDDGLEESNFEFTNEDLKSEPSLSIKVCETHSKLSEDEFGDFENHFSKETEDKPDEVDSIQDEFDDFVSPLPPPQETDNIKEELDDDFGDFESSDLTKGDFEDFGDFSTQTDLVCEKPVMLDIDMKDAATKSEIILKEIFPVIEEGADEYKYINGTEGNMVFDELKDVTETNALIYQWSKSYSQKMFLKSLNIDLRNILYGPAWNGSMPRFAANLGLTPLEPVRTEILTPTPIQNISSPSNSSQKSSSDIPTAQFDWSGSGLINPLDSTSTELPVNVPEDSSQSHVKTDFLPTASDKPEPSLFETETLQKSTKEKTSSSDGVGNFELPKPSNEEPDDFTPFQSPKMVPLRETHISSENDNKPGWLQPTILTPDLPRKESIVDTDDDEFDDFQMVLPEDNKDKVAEVGVKNNTLPDLSEFDMTSKIIPVNNKSHNQEHIFGVPASQLNLFGSGPTDAAVQKQSTDVNNEDDEFTDFHSSLPPTEVLKPLQPVPLEPLKPLIQYTTPTSTQINWPEPGVTDEDIRNIELNYSRKTDLSTNSKKEDIIKNKEMSKENSVEDDEWSDFVSVTNSVKSVLPERTSTPDLPLSVLNLNHVQTPKQPIPVITPAGLVQTKLSSSMMLQPKSSNVVQTTLQPTMFRPPPMQFQPSIISNQFAANLFQGTQNSGVSGPQTQKQAEDDDDWSDFVSSQPLPHVTNGYQQKSSFNQAKTSQVNWGNATPNIITNPSHFDSFQSFTSQQNKKVAPMSGRNAIPSISAMPDLDFIAPKNRTSKK